MVRFWVRSLIFIILQITGVFYKSPSNFSYWWNFGFISLYFLLSQIITGIILAMFYNANAEIVFNVVFDLTNEVYYGWWLRIYIQMVLHFFF